MHKQTVMTSPAVSWVKSVAGGEVEFDIYLRQMENQGAPNLFYYASALVALSEQPRDTLRAWLFSHVNHPYPTELERARLAAVTGYNVSFIDEWMAIARRRLLFKRSAP